MYSIDDENLEAAHILPVMDFREHIPSRDCWCKPMDAGDQIYVHNSLDEREKYERGELRPH